MLLYRPCAICGIGPEPLAIPVGGIFILVDLSFFLANLLKIADGGWLPLTLAAILFLVMTTWRAGTDAIRARLEQTPQSADRFLSDLKSGLIPRVEGTTVFLTRSAQKVSRLIMDQARFVGFCRKIPSRSA